ELESLAAQTPADGVYPCEISAELIVDTRPLIRAVATDAARGTEARVIARRFHTTLVEMIATVCDRIRNITGLDAVVLSGGVFLNALLTREVHDQLARAGFRVFRHRLVPPNDGGLSLGQAAIAAAIMGVRP